MQGIDGQQPQPQQGQPGNLDPTGGKPQLPTLDHSKLKYDPEKLKNAQNTLDVLDAMRPKSRGEYMSAWEKQYGAINDHFDNLQQQLGTRPTDEGMSKKEKFAALLEFGLHLMKNSAAPSQNQGGVLVGTLSDSIDGMNSKHQALVGGEQSAYDTKQQAINSGRAGELKALGTLPTAIDKQSQVDYRGAQAAKDNAGAIKDLNGGNPMIVVDDKGQQWEKQGGEDAWKKSVGIDGKPITRPIGTGSRGGSAHTSVYEESLHEYDKRNPLSEGASPQEKSDHDKAALAYAKGKTTIDSNLYEKARGLALRSVGSRSTYPGTNDEYDRELRSETADTYDRIAGGSPNNMGGPRTPAVISPHAAAPVTPPAPAALMGLKPGFQRHMSDGSVWTIGIDGKPHNLRPPNNHVSSLTLQ